MTPSIIFHSDNKYIWFFLATQDSLSYLGAIAITSTNIVPSTSSAKVRQTKYLCSSHPINDRQPQKPSLVKFLLKNQRKNNSNKIMPSRPGSRLSVDSASLLVSIGAFFVTARWFTNKERQRRALGLWGANTKHNNNAKSGNATTARNIKGTPAEGIIGSRGVQALESPRVPYLEAFMYCLHVSYCDCVNAFIFYSMQPCIYLCTAGWVLNPSSTQRFLLDCFQLFYLMS